MRRYKLATVAVLRIFMLIFFIRLSNNVNWLFIAFRNCSVIHLFMYRNVSVLYVYGLLLKSVVDFTVRLPTPRQIEICLLCRCMRVATINRSIRDPVSSCVNKRPSHERPLDRYSMVLYWLIMLYCLLSYYTIF